MAMTRRPLARALLRGPAAVTGGAETVPGDPDFSGPAEPARGGRAAPRRRRREPECGSRASDTAQAARLLL